MVDSIPSPVGGVEVNFQPCPGRADLSSATANALWQLGAIGKDSHSVGPETGSARRRQGQRGLHSNWETGLEE
jgi:hypothetical protein